MPLARFVRQWDSQLEQVSASVLQTVCALSQKHAMQLSQSFYAGMQDDETAAFFLGHAALRQRLEQSLQGWICRVFAIPGEPIAQRVAQQVHVGEMHARIDVPVHLVLRGGRNLKALIRQLLPEEESIAAHHAACVVDLCMEIMSQSYTRSLERSSRTKDAYRLHAITHNLGTERERQRAALLEWENQLLCDLAMELSAIQLPHIAASDFGLWFQHKGAFVFHGAPEVGQVLKAMELVDSQLLPAFTVAQTLEARMHSLRLLREAARSIAYHLAALFEQHQELDAGRDVLTRLLNRKFLPVVLGKEITHAQQQGESFSILVVDVDHFKKINDRFGHDGGDMVLQQLAEVLQSACRGGDYVFRMGGEEFLLLLVDVGEAQSLALADRLRQTMARESMRLPEGKTMQVTVSIGLAVYDGHPDYARMVKRADTALYRAKELGRNRVEQG